MKIEVQNLTKSYGAFNATDIADNPNRALPHIAGKWLAVTCRGMRL